MNNVLKSIMFALIAALFGCSEPALQYSAQPVPFNQVKITDHFWSSRLQAHANATLETCIAQTQDSTERINNFIKAAGLMEGGHEGIYFDDSDVYKAMEGIAYSLINNPNPEHEALLDIWIAYIAKAQQPDGYLNTFYTLNHPDDRWTDMEKHEMYCGGHMIEAAIAHHKATGKNSFLDVAVKFADYLGNEFGPGKKHWVAGHQEIELALVKLYHETGDKKYLDLSYWLLEERGHAHGKGEIWEKNNWGPAYCQDDVPVSEISDIKGHAVRAMYLFSGMADVAAEKDLPEYVAALERVWEDVVYRNMYITGGIGSSGSNEGFSVDYDLPNKEAYCETCASIGMVLWNNRMNLFSQDAKYIDVMERSMYNGVLSGMSLEGDRFFYVNPLESEGHHHRQAWFGCACCPSNVSRFLPSVGGYIYAVAGAKGIFVNLYVGSDATMEIENSKLELVQKTNYPWDGMIELEIQPEKETGFPLNLRIPGWCKSFSVSINGQKEDAVKHENGYVVLERNWKKGDKVELNLDMPVEVVAADPRVEANIGKRAIQRGPLVYCVEGSDQANKNWNDLQLSEASTFQTTNASGILSGMKEIQGTTGDETFTLIPYFAWDNREAGRMKVWLDYNE
ncbi:beta-L-arabinofuranosidase domain-containing protein [uncultured Draconibacterium sp.]|uniref:glycoside hydrolase family 127 protein n=1 Tax=uncultured Draconibacterium sp. TaxID=1573823 RepID=UPI002AA917CC|nr:beta-L-arabinofuranosidase domain-containing protein [uncultured Draconibacterium sp.]